jgi:hypothetical protein
MNVELVLLTLREAQADSVRKQDGEENFRLD